MREAVIHFSGHNYQAIYGMNYRVKEKVTMADLLFRVQYVIRTEIDVTHAQLSRNNIEMLTGQASFVDATHIQVENSRGKVDGRSAARDHRRGDQAGGFQPESRSTAATSSTAIRFCRWRKCRKR